VGAAVGLFIQELLVALVPLGLLQTGALIYFAGRVTRTVNDHDEAIKEQRETCLRCNRVVGILANKEGISL
jgi:hypothetical protein